MHQRGEMDQLDDHGEIDMLRRRFSTRVRGEQHQRGADALATAIERVADIARDAGIEFLHLKAKPLLDYVEVALDRGECCGDRVLRERGEGPDGPSLKIDRGRRKPRGCSCIRSYA